MNKNISPKLKQTLILAALMLLGAGLVAVWLFINKPQGILAKFDQDVRLAPLQKLHLDDENKKLTFEITELKPAKERKTQDASSIYEGAYVNDYPTFHSLLTVDNQVYKGTWQGTFRDYVDMSYEENGAYESLPYTIKVVDSDMSSYAVVNIHKK